jgi:hypothetical protein
MASRYMNPSNEVKPPIGEVVLCARGSMTWLGKWNGSQWVAAYGCGEPATYTPTHWVQTDPNRRATVPGATADFFELPKTIIFAEAAKRKSQVYMTLTIEAPDMETLAGSFLAFAEAFESPDFETDGLRQIQETYADGTKAFFKIAERN